MNKSLSLILAGMGSAFNLFPSENRNKKVCSELTACTTKNHTKNHAKTRKLLRKTATTNTNSANQKSLTEEPPQKSGFQQDQAALRSDWSKVGYSLKKAFAEMSNDL
ncbi:MAG: hypothetical protein HQL56_12910 [Magnetococcales bacterium]|nr:hypothetical protein [Magnetococcales bacterium]